MATKSPSQFHDNWPAVATTSDLPNISGASTQDSALEIGDRAVVTADGQVYVCRDETLNSAVWAKTSGVPTSLNKNMTASVTSSDDDPATVTTLATTPTFESYIQVLVNGVQVILGDGVKVSPVECFFSGDGGTSARDFDDIVAGDTLHWVGSVAGYQLSATDVIDFNYLV